MPQSGGGGERGLEQRKDGIRNTGGDIGMEGMDEKEIRRVGQEVIG